MTDLSCIAREGEPFTFHDNGQRWVASWHPASEPAPVGNPHGAAAICFAGPDEVVLVSQDGDSWGFPGGRPESGESWRATLEREVSEEACATVSDATLLGFVHGKCIDGGELGLELVRSAWRADVSLEEWRPRHEMTRRAIVPAASALEHIDVPTGLQPIYRRWMREALR